jgi:hypothetical protein
MANHELPLPTCNSGLLTRDSDFRLTKFSRRSSLYSLGEDHTENTGPISSSIVACWFVAAGACLLRRCPAMAVSSRSAISPFQKPCHSMYESKELQYPVYNVWSVNTKALCSISSNEQQYKTDNVKLMLNFLYEQISYIVIHVFFLQIQLKSHLALEKLLFISLLLFNRTVFHFMSEHAHKRILFRFVFCYCWQSAFFCCHSQLMRNMEYLLWSLKQGGLYQSAFIQVRSRKHKEHLTNIQLNNQPLELQSHNANLLRQRNKYLHGWHFHRYFFCFSVSSITEVCSISRILCEDSFSKTLHTWRRVLKHIRVSCRIVLSLPLFQHIKWDFYNIFHISPFQILVKWDRTVFVYSFLVSSQITPSSLSIMQDLLLDQCTRHSSYTEQWLSKQSKRKFNRWCFWLPSRRFLVWISASTND